MLIFIFDLDSWGWSLCLHSLVLTHWHGKRLSSNTLRLYVFGPLLIALYADSKLCHISSLLRFLLSTGFSSSPLHEYVVSQLARYTRRAYLDFPWLSHFQLLLVKISDWPDSHWPGEQLQASKYAGFPQSIFYLVCYFSVINPWIFAPCSKLIQPPLTAELVLVLLATLVLIKLLLSWTDLGQWMDRSSARQEGPKDSLVTQSSNSFLRMICNLFVCLSISSVLEYFGPFFCLCMYVCIEKIHQYQPPHKVTARRLMVNI